MTDINNPTPPAPAPAPFVPPPWPPEGWVPPPVPEPPPPPPPPPPLLRWALVRDGVVANIIEQADAPLIDEREAIELTGDLASAAVGDQWNGEVFTRPQPPQPPRRITRLAFLQRFRNDEAVAIDLASQGATVQAAGMRRYMALVNAATFIDLDRPDTRGGVIALETGGALVEGRALEILDAEIQPHERYTGG